MELRQLRYFLAVARTLNFSRAAEAVHIAQPPLSRQIAKLEAELGVALFTRGPHGLGLTPAGQFFHDRASGILIRVERLRQETAAFAERRSRPLRTAFDLSVLYGRLPAMFRLLREAYPDVEFVMIAMHSAEHAAALRDGTVDFAVGRTLVHDDSLEQVVVRTEPFYLALPADHAAWPGPGVPLRLAAVRNDPFVLYGHRSATRSRDPVSRFLDLAGFAPAQRIEIGDLPAALGLVAAGFGVCIVPGGATRIRTDDVVYALLDEPGAQAPVVLSTLSGSNQEMMARILAEMARTERGGPPP